MITFIHVGVQYAYCSTVCLLTLVLCNMGVWIYEYIYTYIHIHTYIYIHHIPNHRFVHVETRFLWLSVPMPWTQYIQPAVTVYMGMRRIYGEHYADYTAVNCGASTLWTGLHIHLYLKWLPTDTTIILTVSVAVAFMFNENVTIRRKSCEVWWWDGRLQWQCMATYAAHNLSRR